VFGGVGGLCFVGKGDFFCVDGYVGCCCFWIIRVCKGVVRV
jgi:hypothetical protein